MEAMSKGASIVEQSNTSAQVDRLDRLLIACRTFVEDCFAALQGEPRIIL